MEDKVAIIGAGAWGTTLSILLAEKDINVKLWVYEEELFRELIEFRENSWFLPGFQIPQKIEIIKKEKEVSNAKYVVFAVPSQFLRSIAKRFSKYISKDSTIISATKGLEEKTFKRMSEVLEEELKTKNICALSGPNLSKEIASGLPAATVIASKNVKILKEVQNLFSMERFRVYTNPDIIGVEIGGALKNIIALAAGIADGLSLGDNAKAGLIVRGITEITRLGVSLGAKKETFWGLSGIGDLIATCSSKLSRNHMVGERLARGEKLNDILKSMKDVAEGIPTTIAAKKLAKKKKVDMPITNEVYSVLFEEKDPYKAIFDLMSRSLKEEV